MNKLILDGIGYDLSDELVKKIKAEVAVQKKKENPFERILGEAYYYVSGNGKIYSRTESGKGLDDELYTIGNYCCDIETLSQRVLRETLNRLLWRYSVEHDGEIICYGLDCLYEISYNIIKHEFEVMWTNTRIDEGVVLFKKEETARNAIEEVIKPFLENHPEFKYYKW